MLTTIQLGRPPVPNHKPISGSRSDQRHLPIDGGGGPSTRSSGRQAAIGDACRDAERAAYREAC